MTETINGTFNIGRSTLSTNDNLSRMFKQPGLKGRLTSAHPKRLPDGEHINCLMDVPYGTLQVIKYIVGNPSQTPQVLYELKVSNPENLQSWMHDLAVSKHHMALVEQPLFMDTRCSCLDLMGCCARVMYAMDVHTTAPSRLCCCWLAFVLIV
jgi:carotenoid cleavage dioxygenase-like enzyme